MHALQHPHQRGPPFPRGPSRASLSLLPLRPSLQELQGGPLCLWRLRLQLRERTTAMRTSPNTRNSTGFAAAAAFVASVMHGVPFELVESAALRRSSCCCRCCCLRYRPLSWCCSCCSCCCCYFCCQRSCLFSGVLIRLLQWLLAVVVAVLAAAAGLRTLKAPALGILNTQHSI